jgi:1-acyl-sn-glycerol-3-phosphate acyltransferase
VGEEYSVQNRVRIFRIIGRPIFRGIFHLLSRVRITGLGNVPKSGAYLIAMNHVSLYDPPFVLAFWPVAPEAVGASDIWKKRGQSFLAAYYGGIPVHRGEYDRQVIDILCRVLRSGYPLVIAPEGGRSHKPGMRRALPGVAFIVEKTGVPVVPVGITGTTENFLQLALSGKRPLLEMTIGEPFHLPAAGQTGTNRREHRQYSADLIMEKIASLLPPEYQGVYGEDVDSFQAAQ